MPFVEIDVPETVMNAEKCVQSKLNNLRQSVQELQTHKSPNIVLRLFIFAILFHKTAIEKRQTKIRMTYNVKHSTANAFHRPAQPRQFFLKNAHRE